jgi:hypothetical protein
MSFIPSTIFNTQEVSSSAAPLVFYPNGGAAIQTGNLYQINTAWASNNSASPVTLKVWRVPSGGSATAATLIGPQITVPVASLSVPNIPLSMLWGIQLNPGDTIYAQAGTGSAIVVTADGGINTP